MRVWLLPLLAVSPLFADPGVDFFEGKVRPLLAARCYACHSAKLASPMGGLRFDDPATARASVKPNQPDSSRLIQAIRYQSIGMPPGGKLKEEEIATFVKWVEMGAPVPAATPAPTALAKAPVSHWAWQPLRPGAGSIDHQIRVALAANGLTPAPPAAHRTLIRRLSFDLIGLPPADSDFNLTVEQAVDHYLQSPRFGERWARHWMDVARYADTGFLSRPFLISFGYRDWLIEAFNRDVPYDRFLALQLAADQLPGAPRKDHAALGFLSLGQNPNRAVDLPDVVDDKIDLVTRGLLGLTVSCARCHDHKFDPIPTKDYYSLYGVFANTRYGVEPVETGTLTPFYAQRAADRKRILKEYIQERLEALRAEFRAPAEVRRYLEALWDGRNIPRARLENLAREKNLNSLVLARWALRIDDSPLFAQWRAATASPVAAYLENLKKPEYHPLLHGPTAPPEVPVEDFPYIMTEGDANTTRDLQWQYEQMLNDAAYRAPGAVVLGAQDRPVLKPAYVFNRGNQNDLGDPVGRCFPTVLAKACFPNGSGRLDLARAITSDSNPVAARVMVNRVWQRLFGEGLVRTPSDFGIRGDLPTHPGLLDSLAADFRRDGWSVKRLIRRIVLSQTYRQSSADRPEARAKDPENKLLWRMARRRLDFEAMRDGMLSVAGKLHSAIGGQPISIVALPADPRRTIYSIIERERPLALLKTFDVADPEQHSPQRYQTTVPQQGLFLLNSPFVGEMAQAVAAQSKHVPALFRRVLQRDPAPDELERAAIFWNAPPPPERVPGDSPWRYGTAKLDPQAGTVTSFQPFRFFTGTAWQNASAGVDPATGVARLTAAGGAPGDDLASAAVRRWVAPRGGTINIEGKLVLSVGAFAIRFHLSNGIRGWVVSSRQGILGKWRVDPPAPPADGINYAANPSVSTSLKSISVQRGESIDFVVDSSGDYEADNFQWSPVITLDNSKWDARKDFAGPAIPRLTPREQFAQVLLLTNEFAFLD
ncbi:MAG: PSD1 domain-containing protein [Bryobacterales bacterium]|nr:PSD1 domain-containing protein [Bryobacterales bacterium]